MARASVVFLVLCVSALLIGSYMAVAPVEGRPDYLQAMFSAPKPNLS